MTLSRNIFLHLAPGFLILGIYLILAPIANSLGVPSMGAILTAFVIILTTFELAVLRSAKKKLDTDAGLLLNEHLPLRKLAILTAVGFVCCLLVFVILQPADLYFRERIFSGVPSAYFYDQGLTNGYSKAMTLSLLAVKIPLDGIAIPFVEEMYFRGYLMPRLNVKGIFVPIVSGILFALYHFWQPWNLPTLLGISLILSYVAWKNKSYKISLIIHILINLIGSILLFLMVRSNL